MWLWNWSPISMRFGRSSICNFIPTFYLWLQRLRWTRMTLSMFCKSLVIKFRVMIKDVEVSAYLLICHYICVIQFRVVIKDVEVSAFSECSCTLLVFCCKIYLWQQDVDYTRIALTKPMRDGSRYILNCSLVGPEPSLLYQDYLSLGVSVSGDGTNTRQLVD